jgi:arylsulfatase
MRSSVVTIDAELKAGSKGVLYALGGFSGGISVWIDGGKLNYEYNLYEIERTRVTSAKPLAAGKATIEVESTRVSTERLSPMDVTLRVNGQVVATGRVARTTGYSMTGNDSFDVGRDSYSPVSPAYYDRAPFAFDGNIERLVVKYLPQK